MVAKETVVEKTAVPQALQRIVNFQHEKKTSDLTRQGKNERNAIIHEMVKYATGNDTSSFVTYLFDSCEEVVDEAMTPSYLKHCIKTFKVKVLPKEVDVKHCAAILMGKSDLSQRGYNALRDEMGKYIVSRSHSISK